MLRPYIKITIQQITPFASKNNDSTNNTTTATGIKITPYTLDEANAYIAIHGNGHDNVPYSKEIAEHMGYANDGYRYGESNAGLQKWILEVVPGYVISSLTGGVEDDLIGWRTLTAYHDTTITTAPVNMVKRNRLIELDFVETYEIEKSCTSMTDRATITFPKNIQLDIKNNTLMFDQTSTYDIVLGGVDSERSYPPLLMKGDAITIEDGYWYKNENGIDISTNPNHELAFKGFISRVLSDIPIEIECEDNFYLLKRTPFDHTVWNETSANGNTDLYSMMEHIIDLVNNKFAYEFKNNILPDGSNPYPVLKFTEIPDAISAEFSLGYLQIGEISCAELLQKLRDQYHFQSTFIDNSLFFGVTIYNDSAGYSNSKNFFLFSDEYEDAKLIASANIFDSCSLEYCNKEDTVLSATVHCKVKKKDAGRTTKDGKDATKLEKLKIMVYWDILTNSFKYIDLSDPGTVTPSNADGGERHDFLYPININKPAPTINTLFNYGVEHLKKYFYTGFRGSFDTIGFPVTKWNYNVNLIDSILSDRDGQYKVKKVIRRGGNGIVQRIFLDFKNNAEVTSNTQTIFML